MALPQLLNGARAQRQIDWTMVSATRVRSAGRNRDSLLSPRRRYESVVYTIVQSLDCHFLGLMRLVAFIAIGEPMIATPSTRIPYVLAAHIRSTASSIGRRCKVAISGGRFRDWPAVFFAVMTAIDGWLTVGLVPQSTLMAAAVLRRRLTGK